MSIKEIRNANEGNNIESIIFNRIYRHIFMLYPFADVETRIVSVYEDKRLSDGVYVFIVSEYLNFVMGIPPELIHKMIVNEFYTPFHEESAGKMLKAFIEEVNNRKILASKGVEIKSTLGKPLIEYHFKVKRKSLLKRLLGVLK